RVKSFFKYGVITQSIYTETITARMLKLKNTFYDTKEKEISIEIQKLENLLKKHDFENLLKELKNDSMILFKLHLMKKYNLNNKRIVFDKDSLWKDFASIVDEYPVVLSTTHSLRSSTAKNYLYDYLIIDESSQVDIVSGSLSLSCAKNIIIVGDLMQLPHIVNNKLNTVVDKIFIDHKLNPFFNYKNNLLLSFSGIFKDIPKTLLKEHYRCHPKIIDFCNKKFYNDELIILTEESNDEPLTLYKTSEGNHSRGLYNQREIDVIEQEILPEMKGLDIGIISPFRMQTNKLNNIFIDESNIEIDTVHKYQGREKENIVITTVVDRKNDFVDNPNLLNVAISRAKSKLYVVVSDKEANRNIKDLVNYIKYNNLLIKESNIYSIFDLLYKSYAPKLEKYLKKMKNKSEYKSENLMNIIIERVLIKKNFNYLTKALHIPLNRIIKNLSFLDDDEKKFVLNPNTHLDFIIYSKVTKQLTLVIEVDGIKYHENNPSQLKRDKLKDRILDKYNIPIIRFKTNESREEERLIKKLNEIIS
ncbi:MAG: DNA helicase, partial [uncultured Campylobacterales bacterium]